MYLCISFRTCLLHVIKLTSVYNFVQPIALRVNSNACKFAVRQYQFFATMETRAQKSQSRRVQEQRDQFRFASYNDWSRGKTEYRIILILFDVVRVLCVLPNWRNYNGNSKICRENLREKPQRGNLRQNISLSQFNFGIWIQYFTYALHSKIECKSTLRYINPYKFLKLKNINPEHLCFCLYRSTIFFLLFLCSLKSYETIFNFYDNY